MKITEQAAIAAMSNVDPNASDETIARITTDYLMIGYRDTRLLTIMHDVHPSTQRKIDRIHKYRPDYQLEYPIGPCPLPYDWARKNIVGISTKDRVRDRQWCIDALLMGYHVSARSSKNSAGFGCSTIARIRERRREDLKLEWARRTAPVIPPDMSALFNNLMSDKPIPAPPPPFTHVRMPNDVVAVLRDYTENDED